MEKTEEKPKEEANMSTQEIREAFGIFPSAKGSQIMTKVIRKMPGWNEVIDALARLCEMQNGRASRPDPVLAEIINLLKQGRDKMEDALREEMKKPGTIPKKQGPPKKEDQVDWENADWNKTNSDLGRLFGVTRWSARAARKKYAPWTIKSMKKD